MTNERFVNIPVATVDILTYNLNGRPPDVSIISLSNSSSSSSSATGIATGTPTTNKPIFGCEPVHHLASSALLRGREFIKWINTKLPLHIDILCLQEIMWFPFAQLVCDELEKAGWITHSKVDPRQELKELAKNQQLLHTNNSSSSSSSSSSSIPAPPPMEALTNIPKLVGSGLAIFVRSSRYTIMDAGGLSFTAVGGIDHLANKGFRWVVLERNSSDKKRIVVGNLHPMAYIDGMEQPGPLAVAAEGKIGQLLRQHFSQNNANSFSKYKYKYPDSIEQIHVQQLTEIRDHLLKTVLPRHRPVIGVFLAGDFNINRWSVDPGSENEKSLSVEKATNSFRISSEFQRILKLLDASDPNRHPNYKKNNVFSWDGINNVFAQPIIGSKVRQWIDHVISLSSNKSSIWYPFFEKNSKIETSSNMIVRCRPTVPFPELAPLFDSPCSIARSKLLLKNSTITASQSWAHMYRELERQRRKNLQTGIKQFRYFSSKFIQSNNNNNNNNDNDNEIKLKWSQFLQNQVNLQYVSQIWLGLHHYGFISSDPEWSQFCNRKLLRIGDAHPFRMFNHVSDHHPVVGRFVILL
jgi:hypothetical protein